MIDSTHYTYACMGKGFLSEAGEAWLALELGKHCLALQQCVKLSQAMRQAGTRLVKAIDVKLHVHTRRQYGPTTGNIVVLHDAVDCVKHKWLGIFVQHLSLGIGGILPLQVSLKKHTLHVCFVRVHLNYDMSSHNWA